MAGAGAGLLQEQFIAVQEAQYAALTADGQLNIARIQHTGVGLLGHGQGRGRQLLQHVVVHEAEFLASGVRDAQKGRGDGLDAQCMTIHGENRTGIVGMLQSAKRNHGINSFV